MTVISGYDGRRNVVSSTRAALAYLNDLGTHFKGNWYLAIAAYNCGQGKIESAIRRTGSHSFWSLPLPQETKFYVPKLLAVAAIINNPAKYGVTLPPIANEPYFSIVKSTERPNLADVSKKGRIDIDILKALNPDYKGQPVKKDGVYSLLVPKEKVDLVKMKLTQG